MGKGAMRVAVVGGGVSGLTTAYILAKEGAAVAVYEKAEDVGGHANTATVILDDDGDDTRRQQQQQLHIAFRHFNPVAYPDMAQVLEDVGVDLEPSNMSFSMSLSEGQGWEWATGNGFSGLFVQKMNAFNPSFWKLIREINNFNNDSFNYLEEIEHNPDIIFDMSLQQFVKSNGYSNSFKKAFLVPLCASIWPSSSSQVMNFSAYTVLSFFHDHQILELTSRHQWQNHSRQRSQDDYITKVKKELELKGCQIKTNSQVNMVSTMDDCCVVVCKDGLEQEYDRCVIATRAPIALKLLGQQATHDESRILGAFQYADSNVYLHHDGNFMPKNLAAWSSWNFLETIDGKAYMTYWLNLAKNHGGTGLPFLLTINPPRAPAHTLRKWSTSHLIPSMASSRASTELSLIQGKRGIWFCGAYQGYGFHEDGLKGGILTANNLLGKSFDIHKSPKHLALSWQESLARLFVTRFFQQFIGTGCLILVEDGGATFTFEGARKLNIPKVYLRVHSPLFYWKAATESDIGFADAYINGEISFVDKNEGLLNLITIFSANIELSNSASKINKKRGWWTPILFTSLIASTKYFIKNISERNSIPQARLNIASHYDLSNELFSLFMDETMTYSCAIFEEPGKEDLKTAQLRKLHRLIDKARIEKDHHVLELGCGWGSFAIEVVKQTGCKYTGITLSEKQVQYAEMKVKEAGLQEQIKFILCDYRELPKGQKYDRIISCELMEAVGHEYMEEFFKCCDAALAPKGVFVLQTSSIADEKYDEYRLSHGFIKEYIFPGGFVPSLSRITTAMATASRFCVVHLEDNGHNYYYTLRYWRKKLIQNQREIMGLGFDNKFIRTWEYYFDYCASGFKSRVLGNYQMVFSRPGDAALSGNDPHNTMAAFY